ncbi:MAG: hypothetical protein KC425_24085 [Anaerolineales bacterium]|nr:hypothetical protein [Anaerolineales bacterium]
MNQTTLSLRQPGCQVLVALFWIAFSSVFVVIGVTQAQLPFTIFGGAFMAIGVIFLAYALLAMLTRARIGRPELTISALRLRVGESFTVSLVNTFARSITVDELLIQLVFRETAVYQRGTDTETVRHEEIVGELRRPGRPYAAGHILAETQAFQIPPDAMHTLKVRRNRLEWFLRVRMTVPRLPDFVEERELEVVPERVEE